MAPMKALLEIFNVWVPGCGDGFSHACGLEWVVGISHSFMETSIEWVQNSKQWTPHFEQAWA